MPKLPQGGHEQDQDTPLARAVEARPELSMTTQPVFTCGVNRKLNTGNFENLDIYAGLSIPLPGGSLEDPETLQRLVEAAAELGFSITSQETGQRYNALKELQKGGRK